MSDDEKPDLNELLEHYGSRTKSRNTYMTNCPLHEDRTPSMSVRIDEALWNCHSCGEKGDSYTLIQKREEVDFVGARAFAATLGLSTGGASGGDEKVRGSRYGSQRRSTATRKRKVPPGKAYTPAWRRSS